MKTFPSILPTVVACLLVFFSVPAVVDAKTSSLSRSISAKIRQVSSTPQAIKKPVLLRKLQENDPYHRRIQDEDEQTCTPQVIYEDDDDSLAVFANKFGPACACSSREEFDFEAFFAQNPPPSNATDLSGIQTWVDSFNAYLGDLRTSETKGCSNQCSACFSPETDNYCITAENEMTSKSRVGNVKNFTLADLAAFASEPDSVEGAILDILRVFGSSTTEKECYTLTQGGTGTVCLAYQFAFESEEGVDLGEMREAVVDTTCTLSVDDVDCQSCVLDVAGDCIVADCTNIASAPALLDFCNPEATPPTEGVYLPIYDNAVLELEAEGVGACPDTEAITATTTTTASTTTTTSPVATPAASPATGTDEPVVGGAAAGGSTTVAVPEPATTTTATPGTTPVIAAPEPVTTRTDAPVATPAVETTTPTITVVTPAPVEDTLAPVVAPSPVAVPQTSTNETPPKERDVVPSSGADASTNDLLAFLFSGIALVNILY